jgi:nucleoside-diphosphate-sugar epimerase
MKRVIITGAAGFIGANLALRLVREGHEVHLLVRPGSDSWRLAAVRHDARLHRVDLADEETLRAVVGQIKPDWIFHLAAHGAYPSQTDIHRMVQTNLTGTINLVEACLRTGFETLVHTGSSSEYGFKDQAPSEDERLEPNSGYAVTKASATLFCRHIAQSRKVQITTLRLYSVFGPYEEPSRLMPRLILRGLRGMLPPLADPNSARDYIYVDDVSDALLLAAANPGPERGAIFNVGTGVQTSLREAVEIARRLMGIRAEPAWGTLPARQWDTSTWVSQSHKFRDLHRWAPRYSFEHGFETMIRWFREHPAICTYYESRTSVSGPRAAHD